MDSWSFYVHNLRGLALLVLLLLVPRPSENAWKCSILERKQEADYGAGIRTARGQHEREKFDHDIDIPFAVQARGRTETMIHFL